MYGLVIFLIFLCGWFAATRGIVVRAPEVRDYSLQRCEIASGSGSRALKILDAVYIEQLPLLDVLCQSGALAQHFRYVELRSVHRDQLDIRELYEDRYRLLLAKQELMGNSPTRQRGLTDYRQIAHFPDYGSQLVSLNGIPELSAAWLQGKRLGLMDDPNSVSAYQIPIAALRNRGLSDVPEIRYFRSYRQMYRALFAGQIDVIPALVSREAPDSALRLPPGLILQETLPGPAWYLRSGPDAQAVRCAVQAVLKEVSARAPVSFLQELTIEAPCEDA